MIKNLFIDFQARSDKFPYVRAKVFLEFIMDRNERLPRYIKQLNHKAITKCFLEATDREVEGYLTSDTMITRA